MPVPLRFVAAGLLGILGAVQAQAVTVDFQGSTNVGVTYSDNPRLNGGAIGGGLNRRNNRDPGFIYTAGLTNGITVTSPRFNFASGSRINVNYIRDEEEGGDTQLNQNVNGNGNVVIVPGRLSINFSGSSNRRLVDDDQAVSLNQAVANNNRRTVNNINYSPQLTGRLLGVAAYTLQYSESFSFVSEAERPQQIDPDVNPEDTRSRNMAVNISNARPTKIGWGLSYSRSNVSGDAQDGRNDLQSDNINGNLRYRVSRKLTLIANGGFQSQRRPGRFSDNIGVTYSAGFTYSPKQDFFLNLTVGRQFGGLAVNGSLRARLSSKWTLTGSAVTNINTQQRTPLLTTDPTTGLTSIVDPVSGQRFAQGVLVPPSPGFGGALVNPFTGQPLLDPDTGELLDPFGDFGISDEIRRTRRLSLALNGVFGRNEITLNAGVIEISSEIRADNTLINGGLNIRRDLPGRTNVSLTGFVRYNVEADQGFGPLGGGESLNYGGRFRLSGRLGRNLRASFDYNYTRQSENDILRADQNEFEENSVSVRLSYGF